MSDKILIVDDDEMNLKMAQFILVKDNYEVTMASSGPEGLDLLAEGAFALILLDIEMPEMNGFNVLEKIKMDERFSKIPVVMLSGTTNEAEIEKAESYGAVDYITKPFLPERLLECVSRVVK